MPESIIALIVHAANANSVNASGHTMIEWRRRFRNIGRQDLSCTNLIPELQRQINKRK